MNKWVLSGTPESFELRRVSLETQEEDVQYGQEPMQLVNALRYIVDKAEAGDLVELPNGLQLVISRDVGNA